MGIHDVPAVMLIDEVAKELKTKIKQPEFIEYVKSGAHKERVPDNSDWYYIRSASILYRIYKNSALGTEALRSYYGGRKNRGVKPEKKRKASGKVIRSCLQALEKQGLLKKDKKGRMITGAGEKLLYTKAQIVEKAYAEEIKKIQDKAKEAAEKRKAKKAKYEEKPETQAQGKPKEAPQKAVEADNHERGGNKAKKA